MSVLVVSKILRPIVVTLTRGEKYSLDNREFLEEPIQFQLSKEPNFFVKFLLHFWNLHLILNILNKKLSLIVYVFPKL